MRPSGCQPEFQLGKVGGGNKARTRSRPFLRLNLRVGTLYVLSESPSVFFKPILTTTTTAMLRPGLPSDVDAITNVIIKTMPLDPQWDYRFPLRKQYPEDHYKYIRMLFEYFLDPSYDDWAVMVVEEVDPAGCEKKQLKIASISVWDVSYRNKLKHGPTYIPQDRKYYRNQNHRTVLSALH